MSISVPLGYSYQQYDGKFYDTYKTNVSTEKVGLALKSDSTAVDITDSSLLVPNVADSKHTCKTNCSLFDTNLVIFPADKRYIGAHYTGSKLYCSKGGAISNSQITTNAYVIEEYPQPTNGVAKSQPAFCIKGTTSKIRWFNKPADLKGDYQNWDTIFSGCCALMYKGKNVFKTTVADDEYGKQIAPASAGVDSATCHHNPGYGDSGSTASRTMFGMTSAGTAFLVVCRTLTTANDAANYMEALGCYNAILLDGSVSSEFHVRVGSSWSTKQPSMRKKNVALCAYKK